MKNILRKPGINRIYKVIRGVHDGSSEGRAAGAAGILQEVFWTLLMKMNMPQEAAEELMEKLRAKNMGYLFENAEKMDIQAERRNTLKAQKRAEKAEQILKELEQRRKEEEQRRKEEEQILKELEQRRKEAEQRRKEAQQKTEEALSTIKAMLEGLVNFCKGQKYTKEETRAALRDLYQVREIDLERYFEEAWNKNKES